MPKQTARSARTWHLLGLVLAAWVALLTPMTTDAAVAAAPTAPAAPGPALTTPVSRLSAALSCSPGLAQAKKNPVLLVPGTFATPTEDWGSNFMKWLPAAGRPTCTVTYPHRGLGDAQITVEYVVHAVRKMSRISGRKVSLFGHSQGAFLNSFALRFWPDLASKVDDFVSFSGTHHYGTDLANVLCGTPATCVTVFTQFKPDSNLLRAIAAKPLPAGPSYTNLQTRTDEVVIPQPKAGSIIAPGARTFYVQDFCPLEVVEHNTINLVRSTRALAFDAINHRGPADPLRLGRVPCGTPLNVLLGSAPQLLTLVAGGGPAFLAQANPSMVEPPVRCEFTATCTS